GCALQANPHVVQPRGGSCTTNLSLLPLTRRDYCVRNEFTPKEQDSKHEPGLNYATRLIRAGTGGPKPEPRCHVGCVNDRQVTAKEKGILAISRRHGKRECSAAWPVEQVDRVIGDTAGALDVLDAWC